MRSFRALHGSPLSSGPLRRLRRQLRCPAFASGVATPSQKTDRCPCSASAVSAAGSASAAQSRTRGRLPSQALRASSPPGRAKCTPVDRDKLCGKANKNGFFCCNNTTKRAVFMPSQSRSARQLPRTRGSQNVTFRLGLPRLRDCAAEALPAAETAEAEQGQRSAFCEGAATPEAKAGHRNPGGRYKQCGGQPYSRPPQRDPIFRDAKVLLFWCDQQQKE